MTYLGQTVAWGNILPRDLTAVGLNIYFYNIISIYSSVKTIFTSKRKNLKSTLPIINHSPAFPLCTLSSLLY